MRRLFDEERTNKRREVGYHGSYRRLRASLFAVPVTYSGHMSLYKPDLVAHSLVAKWYIVGCALVPVACGARAANQFSIFIDIATISGDSGCYHCKILLKSD